MYTHQKELCFIDIETTGAIFGFHEIVEIGVIRTSPDAKNILLTWNKRINPTFPDRITEVARRVNGFNAENWSPEKATKQFWDQFVLKVKDAVPICHNPSFERGFISLAANCSGVSDLGLDHHWIGTESIAWPIVKNQGLEKFSLAGLCNFFGVESEANPHSALGGAEACLRVYRKLMELNASNVCKS